ncbi:hypothetical protein [Streptomyces violaceusniger]|uniref:Nitrate reductase n=1 Tax=Streptomyces violaceusniger TaxID=68280 RepID=A0A4D4L179_STRVO|nr:hypothetical protein SVIO_024220 [Streptomyces violaceusniger]
MPLGARPGQSPQLRELRQSVRRLLGLDDDTAVVIRQLACAEPGCPPLETVIAVFPMNGRARRWTLHATVAEIAEDDLRAALLTHNPKESA